VTLGDGQQVPDCTPDRFENRAYTPTAPFKRRKHKFNKKDDSTFLLEVVLRNGAGGEVVVLALWLNHLVVRRDLALLLGLCSGKAWEEVSADPSICSITAEGTQIKVGARGRRRAGARQCVWCCWLLAAGCWLVPCALCGCVVRLSSGCPLHAPAQYTLPDDVVGVEDGEAVALLAQLPYVPHMLEEERSQPTQARIKVYLQALHIAAHMGVRGGAGQGRHCTQPRCVCERLCPPPAAGC
jgi:hypothetical protein